MMTIERGTLFTRLCDELGGHDCSRLSQNRFRLMIDSDPNRSKILSHGSGGNKIAVRLVSTCDEFTDDVQEEYPLVEEATSIMLACESVTLDDLVEAPDCEALLRRVTASRWTKQEIHVCLPSSRGLDAIFRRQNFGTFEEFCGVTVRFICTCSHFDYKSASKGGHPLRCLVTPEDLQHMWDVFEGTVRPKPLF